MSWPFVSVETLVKISKGKKHNLAEGGAKHRYIQIDDLRNDNLLKYTDDEKGVFVEADDVIIAWDGANAGTIGYGLKGLIGSTLARLTIINSKIDSEYLGRFLQSKFREIRDNCTGATIPHVSKAHLISLIIPLPPLPVQKQIAAVLEKADTLRQQCQQMEQELNTLAQSVFLDMFGDPVKNPKGWKAKKLKDLVTIQSGATPSKANDSLWVGEFPWVSPKDMKSIYIYDSIDHVSEKVFEETNLKLIQENTILIVVRGMILVHTVPLAITKAPISINQDIKALNVSDNSMEPLYLLWCLKCQHDNILSKVSTAAHGTKRLDMPDLVGLDICIPPILIQQKFCGFIRRLDKQLQFSRVSVTNHELLFNSLMQRAFKGELELKDVA